MKKLLFSILIFGVAQILFAQNQPAPKEKHVVEFSGMIFSSDSLETLPFAVIFDKTVGKGTYSNYAGFFSFAAAEGDSIYFMYTGYRKKLVRIPFNLKDDR